MNRPKTYTIAAMLQWLISGLELMLAIPALTQSPNAANAPPFFIIVLAFVARVLGLVSAYGVWRNQKWGVIATILLRALDGLTAAPGMFFAPTTFLCVSSIISTVASLAIIVLLLWPKPRLARVVPNL